MDKPECNYGRKCYRLNQEHLEQFSHAHLDNILKSEDNSGKYKIPDDSEVSIDIIKQQLVILKNIQKKNKRNEKDEIERPAKIPKIEENLPSTSRQAAGTSQLNNDMKDFFKQRAALFKSKNPEEMKAPPKTHPKGCMAERLVNAAPYNFFLTRITDSPLTHKDPSCITFPDLFDSSLGELESSVQFNFVVDITWLIAQYTQGKVNHLPLLILHGRDDETLANINNQMPNVTSIKISVPYTYGCHHTKMMLFFYKDQSMRVIVSTANLYMPDWHNRTQGLWISEKLPKLPENQDGKSATKFREDLISYLNVYNLPNLQPAIARIRSTDFSSVNVFFVTSVPGTHKMDENQYGHPKIGQLLNENSAPIDDKIPIIVQASSLGSFGPQPHIYLLGEVVQSFRRDSAPPNVRKQPIVKVIYPTLKNVTQSYDGILGADCLTYRRNMSDNQPWLLQYLHKWRCASRDQSRAIPHIKSYSRHDDNGLFWFLLTSANLSQSALGKFNKGRTSLKINSYEAGVLFCPRIIIKKDRFPMNKQQCDGDNIFQLPFDTPLTPYDQDDVPFTIG